MAAAKSKFNYEIGAEYLWNHVSKNKNIQSLVKAGDLETVQGYLDTIIRQAKANKNHPLNFNNIVKKHKGRGFVEGIPVEEDYYKTLLTSKTGVQSLINDPNYSKALGEGWTLKNVGGEAAEFAESWTGDRTKRQGIVDAILESPDGKTTKNLSYKQTGALGSTPSQGKLLNHAKLAAKRLGLPPEAITEYQKALKFLSQSDELLTDLQKDLGMNSKNFKEYLKNNRNIVDELRVKQHALIGQAQGSAQKIYDKYPGFADEINQGLITGKGQYARTIDNVVTFGEGSKVINPADTKYWHRFSLGKDFNRPSILRLDIYKNQGAKLLADTSNQIAWRRLAGLTAVTGLTGLSALATGASAAETGVRTKIAAETKNPLDIAQAGISGFSLANDLGSYHPVWTVPGTFLSGGADLLNVGVDRFRYPELFKPTEEEEKLSKASGFAAKGSQISALPGDIDYNKYNLGIPQV